MWHPRLLQFVGFFLLAGLTPAQIDSEFGRDPENWTKNSLIRRQAEFQEPPIALSSNDRQAPLVLDQARIQYRLQPAPGELLLPIRNNTVQNLSVAAKVEMLDVQDRVLAQATKHAVLDPGLNGVSITVGPPAPSDERPDHSEFLWYRFHWQISTKNQLSNVVPAQEGYLALSQINSDLFEINVAAASEVRTGHTYHNVVRAYHPISLHPVAGVAVKGTMTFGPRTEWNSSALTDENGAATLVFPQIDAISGESGEVKFVASLGDYQQHAVIEVKRDRRARILISTDKPLYQPGQILQTRAIFFEPGGKPLANLAVRFRIKDFESKTVNTLSAKTSRFGVAATDWQIPDNARLGDYRVYAQITAGAYEGVEDDRQVSISRYELPSFSVDVKTDRPYYLPNQEPQVEVAARYLFGKPVTSADVRLVREKFSHWSPRKGSWDSREESQRSEMLPDGRCLLRVPIPSAFWDFKDGWRSYPYAAYVTDTTTGRTEQRRFTIRLTRQEIHIEVSAPNSGPGFPLRLHVQTAYADGTPAQCRVTLRQKDDRSAVTTVQTNRFGLAKVALPKPKASSSSSELNLVITAEDGAKKTGRRIRDVWLRESDIKITTAKTLHRRGEPIVAHVEADSSVEAVELRLIARSQLVDSHVIRLRDGAADLNFPYRDDFEKEMHLLAYDADEEEAYYPAASTTVLYPSPDRLKVEAHSEHPEYRPGEQVNLGLTSTDRKGAAVESALGVVVTDKAVTERAKSREEFGLSRSWFRWFWVDDQEIAGISRADLLKLDLAEPPPADLDLLAEFLVHKRSYYYPPFARPAADRFERKPAVVFKPWFQKRIETDQIEMLLLRRLSKAASVPGDHASLCAALKPEFDLAKCADPWGRPLYSEFKREQQSFLLKNPPTGTSSRTASREKREVLQQIEVVTLKSAGPDGRLHTGDDFEVAQFSLIASMVDSKTRQPILFGGGRQAMGTIKGVVRDMSPTSIPGVQVKIVNKQSLQETQAVTDDHGEYAVLVTPGIYKIRFSLPGFRTSILNQVPARAGLVTVSNCRLVVGEINEAVTVNATAGDVMTSRSEGGGFGGGVGNGEGPAVPPRLRQSFPETLIWQPLLETDRDGKTSLTFKLADNITTWRLSVIASDIEGNTATGETEIRSFQPFFIDYDPPVALTEGDEVHLPVVVRNYLDEAASVHVSFQTDSKLQVLGGSAKELRPEGSQAASDTFQVRAASGSGAAATRVTATGVAGDAVEKKIQIRPDGEEIALSTGDAFRDRTALTVKIPQDAIMGTIREELKIYPDLMSHAFEGIEGILRRPYGCAEQTISSTYPNLIVLRYLEGRGEDYAPVGGKALSYLRKGYERLLGYRSESGGFAYWGKGEADVALTAYALRFLSDARHFIDVDSKVIEEAQNWLTRQQSDNGSWPQSRHFHGKGDTLKLTAGVAAALAMARVDVTPTASAHDSTAATEAIRKALKYISAERHSTDDAYLLARYALAAAESGQSDDAAKAIEELRAKAHDEKGMVWWETGSTTPYYGWGLAGRLETTAAALQAILRVRQSGPRGELDSQTEMLVNRTLRFLVQNKDRFGVWHSTHATVNVLEALLAARDWLSRTRTVESGVRVFVNGQPLSNQSLAALPKRQDPLILDLTKHLSTGANQVEIRAERGSALMTAQLVSSFYVPWKKASTASHSNRAVFDGQSLQLDVSFDRTELQAGQEVTCKVGVQRGGEERFGMLLGEIGIPPGSEVDRGSLESAAKSDASLGNYDVLPDRVVVYLWSWRDKQSFSFKFRPRFAMKAQSAPSALYDYYNPEARVVLQPALFVVR